MLTIKLNVNVVGETLVLNEGDAEPWDQTLGLMIVDVNYEATLTNGFTIVNCVIMKTTADELIVVFNETVVVPSGACIVIDIATPNEEGCTDPTEVLFDSLSEGEKSALRVVLFNQENCPLSSLTLGQLKSWITGE